MFNRNNTKWINEEITWKKALKIGVQILVKNGIATSNFYDAILEAVKKYGAYFILGRGIALAHAPIGIYNQKPGVSLVILKDEIEFNSEQKYAKIIVTISAIDTTSHMAFIKEFGEVFGNELLKRKLLKASSLKHFLQIYHKKGGVNGN